MPIVRYRMNWEKRAVLELTATILMAAAVSILAILQYRWTSDVNRAGQDQIKAALQKGVRDFNQEFSYDFERLCESFEIDPAASASTLEARVAQSYQHWLMTASNPDMVAGLQIWRIDSAGDAYLEAFDPATRRFQDAVWVSNQAPLRTFLQQQEEHLPEMTSGREAVYFPWTLHEDTPGLVRPLFHLSSESEVGVSVQPVGFLVIDLNKEYLDQTYFPALVQQAFGDSGFRVEVRSASAPFKMVFESEPSTASPASGPLATLNLMHAVGEEAKRRGHAPLQGSSPDREWHLAVQYPAGSLGEAVAIWRRRSVAISFGLLAILTGSAVLIFFVSRRAERLALLRAEFVASVSHELGTPLAVIKSASENLIDGIVDSPQQVREYGAMIRDQGNRLERLVDQALAVSAGRSNPARLEVRALEIAPIIEKSLQASEPMLREAGFSVRTEIGEALPVVMADSGAAAKCIENLLSNAVKYSGKNHRVSIRAWSAPESAPPEVRISVEDEGVGIPAGDLLNVFEPFYRGIEARESHIRGAGLGLHLVKRMMESMGGCVTASSEPGRGSSFTLHFRRTDAAISRGRDSGPVVHKV
jgi:two-component system, OmpR family, sensor histidine kinase SenX3